MKAITVNLIQEKETKGTVRYVEKDNTTDSDEAVIPTLYVRKTAFGNETPPVTIQVILK